MNGMFRQSMTWLHTWSGLVFCWVLYLVFVTGTLGYFDNEIDHWMQPEYTLEPSVPITQSVTAGQSYLQQAGADADSWFITPARDRDALYLNVFWRTPDPENEGQTLFEQENLSNVNGAPLAEPRDTTGGQTLYRMHYNLHYLPSRIGFYFVAVATMIMFVGLITGVIAHKKIFADFFTFRWAKGQRSWLDMHNLRSILSPCSSSSKTKPTMISSSSAICRTNSKSWKKKARSLICGRP
ncbi:MAG: PepSY-associated TM helix domain-containing protein [Pseudomonadota bacterium]